MEAKRIFSRIILSSVLTLVGTFAVYGKTGFSHLVLNQDSRLLFTVSQRNDDRENGDLCLTRLTGESGGGGIEVLTCGSGEAELLDSSRILQVRNRWGRAWLDLGTGKLEWKEKSSFPEIQADDSWGGISSPDGKYFCYVKKNSYTTGKLMLVQTSTGKEVQVSEKTSLLKSTGCAKWAKDSKVFIYQDAGGLFFCNPEAVFRNILIESSLRKIGNGNMNSVNWTEDGKILYVDGDIVYSIQENELWNRSLFSAYHENQKVFARLAMEFDFEKDEFSASPDGKGLLVIHDGNLVVHYNSDYSESDISGVRNICSLNSLDGNVFAKSVFWSGDGNPFLIVLMQKKSNFKFCSKVYSLGGNSFVEKLETDANRCFAVSPDRKFIVLCNGNENAVYSMKNWNKICSQNSQRTNAVLWLDKTSLVCVGQSTIYRWNLKSKNGDRKGTIETLYLSSVKNAMWMDNRIVAQPQDGNEVYEYSSDGRWTAKSGISPAAAKSDSNGSYRVYTGNVVNSEFENGIFVRNLSGASYTYPLISEFMEKKDPSAGAGTKKVALAFDCMDSCYGISSVLAVLRQYGIKATFFINGEFIRRYPNETKLIALSGNECASLFFSTVDLTSSGFPMTEEYVVQGLARNEDEFYQCTGRELSLSWHAPFHHADDRIRVFGINAGYSYVDCWTDFMDFSDGDYSAENQICRIIESSPDRIVVPVSLGKAGDDKKESLYRKLDLLIQALLENGYEIVGIDSLS